MRNYDVAITIQGIEGVARLGRTRSTGNVFVEALPTSEERLSFEDVETMDMEVVLATLDLAEAIDTAEEYAGRAMTRDEVLAIGA